MAAVILSGEVERERYAYVSARARRIYDLMKNEHPFLTSSEDAVFAAIFALSEKADSHLLRDAERCYDVLKSKFHDKNALQSLSHVLALADGEMGTVDDKCRNTAMLYDMLKEKKQRYGTGYELSTLGSLATLPGELEEIASDLIDVSEFLKTQKGYGFFGIDKKPRLMHAAMIVTSERIGGSDANSYAAINGTVSMIAAQHAALCASLTISMAATCAASSARRSQVTRLLQ